jgi:hypothetical protein
MDGSWGIRSNKWTTYGGATSDGCQILFTLFADKDPRYVRASLKNLEFLRKNMRGGLIGYGPQHWEVFNTPPCIYPTFTKAKNLAFAYDQESQASRIWSQLPTEKTGWMKYFTTLDVVLTRTKNLMATITGYGYEDHAGRSKSKYMYRPTGGAMSNLWVQGHGFLQASSVTVYSRPEPMSFPEAPGIRSLTPRIEYTDSLGYFTNLFEFDSRMETKKAPGKYQVSATGELKDKNWLCGGVGYTITHTFTDTYVEKRIKLVFHDSWPTVHLVEPIIQYEGMRFEQPDPLRVRILTSTKKFEIRVVKGKAEVLAGKDKDKYWSVYPALKAFPIELLVAPPSDGFVTEITYRLSIVD